MELKSIADAQELAHSIRANGIEVPENVLIGALLTPEYFDKCMDMFKLYNVDFNPALPSEFMLNTDAGIKFVIGKK